MFKFSQTIVPVCKVMMCKDYLEELTHWKFVFINKWDFYTHKAKKNLPVENLDKMITK